MVNQSGSWPDTICAYMFASSVGSARAETTEEGTRRISEAMDGGTDVISASRDEIVEASAMGLGRLLGR